MTINSTAAASGPFIGTGVSQTLPFDFNAASIDEIAVEVDGLLVDVFTVFLNDDGTGSVTGTFPVGSTIFIESAPAFTQDTDFGRFAPYYPDAINAPLDRAAIRDIALLDAVSRTPRAPRNAAMLAGKFPVLLEDGTWGYVDGVPGVTGASDSAFLSLTALKAISPVEHPLPKLKTAEGVANYAYINGDFTGKADDINVIALDDVPLNIGALVRQGAQDMGYAPPAPAVIVRSTEDRLADSIRAHDHGAYGDASPHPLSERFSSLDRARAAYPGCTIESLTDRGDGVAIEAAINRAKKFYLPGSGGGYLTRAVAQLRHGRYTISRSIRLPNSVTLRGAGGGATIIDAQNHTVNGPLIVNDEPGSIDMRVEGLSLHGGTHGVKIDSGTNGQVNSLWLADVQMRLQSDKCFEVNRLLQLAYFDHVIFADAPYGLYAPAWTSNALTLLNCGFESIPWIALLLRSAEAVNIIGGRFEAGGNGGQAGFTGSISGTTLTVSSTFSGIIRAGGALIADGGGAQVLPGTSIVRQLSGTIGGAGTYEVSRSQTLASRTLLNRAAMIDLDRATVNDSGCQVSVRGTYIENTSPLMVRDYGSRDGVSLDGCHFTKALNSGGFDADYYCESDGVIQFGSNDWGTYDVKAPANVLVTGQNSRLRTADSNTYTSRVEGATRFRSRRVTLTTGATIPAVSFKRSASTGNVQTSGVLTVNVSGFDGTSGAAVSMTQRFRIIVYINGGVLLVARVAEAVTGIQAGATLDVQPRSGATMTSAGADIIVGGLNGSTPSAVWYTFSEDEGGGGGADVSTEYLKVTAG